ncbi:DHH family phosphoesterase [Clostridium sp.]|uniref:DHH family phosphoesterase n=1 Tax=Clostridium sp. TaxID=1506 RepID=UPI001A3DBDFB|nr:DHH family phosphoesterase [Clostridium sp.]MBK5243179.1 hypothetical protein [Clostridium sp.]
MNKQWNILIPKPNPKDDIIGSILAKRNISNPVHFLKPLESDLLPFEDLSNIKEAADMVLKAIDEGKRVHILSDCDNDGVNSSAIILRYLRDFTTELSWSINSGKQHGIEFQDLESYIGKYDLVIAVDSSSSSYEAQKFLVTNNIDFLCLDHHPCEIEKCSGIIVNSTLNSYKNKFLSGSGVCLKFVLYLDYLQGTTGAEEFYDLAASGIIGDMMDISEASPENRYICMKGFNSLNNPGLKAIVGDYPFTSTCVAFSISPILNAGVRTNHGELSAQILLKDDKKVVKKILNQLKELKEIQNIQKDKLVAELENEIEERGIANDKVMGFNVKGDTQTNLTGLVANVISSKYDCLVIIVHPSEKKGLLRGSIRGNCIDNFKQLILDTRLSVYCMGHFGAAGIGVYESRWNQLITTLNKNLEDVELKITSQVDIILKPSDITTKLIKKLEYVNIISGTGFKPINILIEGLEPENISTMKLLHSKFEADGMEFIQWHSDLSDQLKCDKGIYKTIDVVSTVGIGNFRGKKSRQAIIQDYRIESHLEFFR